jgi:hypothetical protein
MTRADTILQSNRGGNRPKSDVSVSEQRPGPWHADMLYYNNYASDPGTMTQHHHHHHPHGHAHPPAAIGPSILRLSVLQRLAVAAVLTALVWTAVLWAMHS